jgi:uncharacterized membrane protein YecN with MAPEG domain
VAHTSALPSVFSRGRAIHAYGVSQVQEDYRLRSTGMAIRFAVIAVTALSC